VKSSRAWDTELVIGLMQFLLKLKSKSSSSSMRNEQLFIYIKKRWQKRIIADQDPYFRWTGQGLRVRAVYGGEVVIVSIHIQGNALDYRACPVTAVYNRL
jgi:hypothetical protein